MKQNQNFQVYIALFNFQSARTLATPEQTPESSAFHNIAQLNLHCKPKREIFSIFSETRLRHRNLSRKAQNKT